MRVGIATDHGGFQLKNGQARVWEPPGHEVVDFGAHHLERETTTPTLSPRLRVPWRQGAWIGEWAICGSGVGASVCANKIPGIRAGLVGGRFRRPRAWKTVA